MRPVRVLACLALSACGPGDRAQPAALDATKPSGEGGNGGDGGACEIARGLVDLGSDDHNCGSCGHDCTACGGRCQNGMCTAALVASAPQVKAPRGLAIDATRVYFTDMGSGDVGVASVQAVAKSGGTPTVLLSGLTGSYATTLAGTRVFWSDISFSDTSVNAIEATGGPRTTFAVSAATMYMASDGSNVVWQTSELAILRPGASQTSVLDATPPSAIALDAAVAYYGVEHGVKAVPLAGGSPVALASVPYTPAGVAVSGGRVYFTDGRTAVQSVSIAGGATTTIVPDRYAPTAIVADDAAIYWIEGAPDPAQTKVMKAHLDGGDPTQLATIQAGFTLALDDRCVYFDGLDGPILRVAK